MRSVLQEVVSHLAAKLDVPVSTDAPAERPDAFVLVQPVGGMSNILDLHPQYAIQAWARTTDAAEELVRDCCDAMLSLNAELYADPVPLGYDGEHRWWQVTWTVNALW